MILILSGMDQNVYVFLIISHFGMENASHVLNILIGMDLAASLNMDISKILLFTE